MSHYDTLELKPGATQDEIKKAFRRLAHIHHPDKGGNEAKFKEINNAYQELLKGHSGGSNPYEDIFKRGFEGYTYHMNDFSDGFWYGYDATHESDLRRQRVEKSINTLVLMNMAHPDLNIKQKIKQAFNL